MRKLDILVFLKLTVGECRVSKNTLPVQGWAPQSSFRCPFLLPLDRDCPHTKCNSFQFPMLQELSWNAVTPSHLQEYGQCQSKWEGIFGITGAAEEEVFFCVGTTLVKIKLFLVLGKQSQYTCFGDAFHREGGGTRRPWFHGRGDGRRICCQNGSWHLKMEWQQMLIRFSCPCDNVTKDSASNQKIVVLLV